MKRCAQRLAQRKALLRLLSAKQRKALLLRLLLLLLLLRLLRLLRLLLLLLLLLLRRSKAPLLCILAAPVCTVKRYK